MNKMSKPTLYSRFRKTVKKILESPSEIPSYGEGGTKTLAELQEEFGRDIISETMLKAIVYSPVERPPRPIPSRVDMIRARETLEKMAKQMVERK